ncbi:MAG: M28 family peptidase [Pirellulales bacterium]|nr:M28 family peptidase [Pirellulales bacterium]
MRSPTMINAFSFVPAVILLFLPAAVPAQPPVPKSLRTPLPPDTIGVLSSELSGQRIHNNLVRLAGAPWLRTAAEFSDTFYESRAIHDLLREYGVSTTRLEKHPGAGTFEYPTEGELRMLEPQKRLVACLEADPALVARGSRTADITGELIYLSPAELEAVGKASQPAPPAWRGKVALLWSHPSGQDAKKLADAGVQAVVAFNARDRYTDPNQAVYSSGSYEHDPLAMGLTVSWRQWSELLEDLHLGKKIVVRAKARVEKVPDRSETVYSWIPGTEPDGKGVLFTAHLFDGYVKRGANDNMSGCAIQLEILRAVRRLIVDGQLPQPRRTIHFLWTNEVSGTYAFLQDHPGFGDRVSIAINMDMVGEGLRSNNAVLRMGQSPGHLPSYIDGLARSILNYVWRTNDVIFMADGPRGRPGGQYFPVPMVEKNGSSDAFRFDIRPTMGGSDQICFHNPSVAVPAIMLLIWPDLCYHADTDTPDRSDPTQLKRAAFIGAACAWAAACCTDDVAAGLAEAVSEYGFLRVAERELPRALGRLQAADAAKLPSETAQALALVSFGAGRELGALGSIADVFSGSEPARKSLESSLQPWELYRTALGNQITQYAAFRAAQLKIDAPAPPQNSVLQQQYEKIIPTMAPAVKGRQFDLSADEKYSQAMKDRPDAMKTLGITRAQATAILNYVNGKRSIAEIRTDVAGDLDEAVPLEGAAGYLELLKSVGWVVY